MIKKYKFKILTENIITKEEAYWISPSGKILFVDKKHIDAVIEEPKAFGYTTIEIEKLYNKYGETFGVEGKAREQIMLYLFKKGWIRIRKYLRPYRWTLNVSRLDSKIKDKIKFFADMMLKRGYSKFDEILIDTPRLKDIYTFKQLSDDVLYLKENMEIPKSRKGLQEVKTFL